MAVLFWQEGEVVFRWLLLWLDALVKAEAGNKADLSDDGLMTEERTEML